jgi:3-O-methylgallate 3,4-dioxygenase
VHASVPELGKHITECLMDEEFDITAIKRLPGDETPHAFGFVFRQIMNDRVVPTVPVLVNTFYGPNQPRARRCVSFGRALGRAIESWPSDVRVAVIASGGLTHFAIDESVDRKFLAAIESGRIDSVAEMKEATFQAGTSELKNWIPVAAAMETARLKPTIVDYVPCYRSIAGTGNAMGFVHWLPSA